jgi:hypothetical protein
MLLLVELAILKLGQTRLDRVGLILTLLMNQSTIEILCAPE